MSRDRGYRRDDRVEDHPSRAAVFVQVPAMPCVRLKFGSRTEATARDFRSFRIGSPRGRDQRLPVRLFRPQPLLQTLRTSPSSLRAGSNRGVGNETPGLGLCLRLALERSAKLLFALILPFTGAAKLHPGWSDWVFIASGLNYRPSVGIRSVVARMAGRMLLGIISGRSGVTSPGRMRGKPGTRLPRLGVSRQGAMPYDKAGISGMSENFDRQGKRLPIKSDTASRCENCPLPLTSRTVPAKRVAHTPSRHSLGWTLRFLKSARGAAATLGAIGGRRALGIGGTTA